MTLHIFAVVSGWIVLLLPFARLVHSSGRMKGRSIGSGSTLRSWPAVAAMTVGFIGFGVLLWIPLPFELDERLERAVHTLGSMVYFPAIGLYIWGWLTLGKMYGVSNSGGADLYSNHHLVMHGPYKYVRHPMYLAVMLASIGALLIFQTWAMLIFVPLSWVVIWRSNHEETLIEMEFGSDWREYKNDVPKWFPRLFRKR